MPSSQTGEPLLRVEGLVKYFPILQGILFKKQVGTLKAVDGVTFDLHPRETLGLVGESGCGKSTVAKTILRLDEPTEGKAYFEGRDIFAMNKKELRSLRREIQVIFQDPYSSLNPRMTVGDIVAEPWEIHRGESPKGQQRQKVQDLLHLVGLNPDHINRFPHQFSGGQRQRIGVARALALNPKVIICDEPVSALDVSVQAQVINLLESLQDELNLAYVFIAHDLSIVRHISDRVAVMYLGRIVEIGTEEEIYDKPTHPYTQALLAAVPVPNPDQAGTSRVILEGDVPSPADPPSGCTFRTRCWKVQDICAQEVPELIDRFGHGHPSRCFFADTKISESVGAPIIAEPE